MADGKSTRPGKHSQFANLNMVIEIVDLASYKFCGFSSSQNVNVYQRVSPGFTRIHSANSEIFTENRGWDMPGLSDGWSVPVRVSDDLFSVL